MGQTPFTLWLLSTSSLFIFNRGVSAFVPATQIHHRHSPSIRVPPLLSSSPSSSDANSLSSSSKFKDYPVQLKINQDVLKDVTKDTKLVGSIDQGTSSTRFIVFTDKAQILASAQVEQTQYYPSKNVGWHEHDGLEIWHRTVTCMTTIAKQLEALKDENKIPSTCQISGIGITNQRETTIAWNAETGKPYYKAIVWDDVRTSAIARQLANTKVDRFRKQTGLPVASYFAGTKVRWLIDNVGDLRRDLQDDNQREKVRFGTMDTWLLYQLTGTKKATFDKNNNSGDTVPNVGGIFATDVSNASRWLFLDIRKVQWDPKLIRKICNMDIPLDCFPSVCPSSHLFGSVSFTAVPGMEGVPLAAVLGDQQAALFGQCAFQKGESKNTYGTGMFLMMNTGTELVTSKAGLLTTLAYQIGTDGPVHYALEGSVAQCGSVIQWLRDQLNLIEVAKESDELALQTESNDGLYFVPAFSGLFAPYWRSDARGCIVGMTSTHHKGHICRAALEAAAYQAREVFDAIYSDSNVPLYTLRVDGGGTQSKLLMQFQADILGVPVEKPLIMETTALGAAFAAGLATGVWKDLDEIQKFWKVSETYTPQMKSAERQELWNGWKKAVDRSLGWVEPESLAGSVRRRTVFARLRIRLKRARRRAGIRARKFFASQTEY